MTAMTATTPSTPVARAAADLTAGDVMSREPVVVPDDLTVAEAIELFAGHEISGAPVRDRDGKLVGVVSLADIARAGAEGGDLDLDRSNPLFAVREWGEHFEPGEFARLHVTDESRTVGDVMTPAVYTVPEEMPVSGVARTMLDAHLHRVVVVRGDEPVGVISSLDLLRLLV
jgi:CBS domain-containing protein